MMGYRPDGVKMYVANKDIEFMTYDLSRNMFTVHKGEVWMLQQITFSEKVWLSKTNGSESILQIGKEQLENDFVEVKLDDINMSTSYSFSDGECTEKTMLNGYEVKQSTYQWSFEDFANIWDIH